MNNKINCKRKRKFYENSKSYKEESVFFSLAPKDDVDEKNLYYDKFMTAVDKGCKIIAFTGRYGIGKTSIINSIIKKLDNNNREIRISLGNYKKSDTENHNDKINLGENISLPTEFDTNYIETKILQQIIYTTNENKLPMSRFKRIRYVSKSKKRLFFIISILIMVLVYIYFPQVYDLIIQPMYNNCIKILPKKVTYAICFILLLAILYIIYKILNLLNVTINISSLKYKDLELAINNSDERSVFNKYLDEIVYFFKQTQTNTVIIEDLDRYGDISLEIFKNLKELNFLLNSNETIRKNGGVIFIYALRDDLFLNNEDRVKFFDNIIPVVSKFSSQNAKEYIMELYEEIRKSYENLILDEKLLRIVSIYIQDRRLLLNIFMEFKTYIDALKDNQDINYTELFAVISYKNINPVDFEKRLKYDGNLYKLFNSKDKLINILNKELVRENAKINEEIAYAVRNNNLDIIDLKKSFILDAIKNEYYRDYIKNIKLYFNGEKLSLDDFLLYEIDTTMLRSLDFSYEFPGYSSKKINSTILNDFLDKVDNIKSDFSIKKKEMDLNIEQIKKNNDKSIEEILNTDSINDLILDEELKKLFKNKLLISLVKNGFIKENYEKNLSYFKSGDLSHNDYNFLIYVDTNDKLEFNYEINNLEKVFESIETKDFCKYVVLNFNLCDFLLKNKESSKTTNFYQQFTNMDDYRLRFLENYLYYNEKKFITLLKKIENDNLYCFVLQDEKVIQDKNKWMKAILENIELNPKKETIELFKTFLNNHEDIYNNIEIGEIFEKNIRIIKPNINNYEELNLEIINSLYKNDIYNPNKSFYNRLIDSYKVNSNYKINGFLDLIYGNAGFLEFKNKVIRSINFEDIYNSFEICDSNESNIINALNELELNIESKLLILKKENNKISRLTEIEDRDLWKDIIKMNCCIISMENILAYYEVVDEIDENIIKMLEEIGNNYDVISNVRFKDFEDELIYSKYSYMIKYEKIAEKFDYSITNFKDDLKINENFISELINYNKVEINANTYKKIYDSQNSNLLIKLITKNIENFINILNGVDIDYEVIDGIINRNIDITNKIKLLNSIKIGELSNESITRLIDEIVTNNIYLGDEIVNELFEFAMEEDKIQYFIYLHSKNQENIKYLYKINDKISKIRNGSSTTMAFEYNATIKKLMEYLKSENIINNLEIIDKRIRISYSKEKI